jgi:hypothetical protein
MIVKVSAQKIPEFNLGASGLPQDKRVSPMNLRAYAETAAFSLLCNIKTNPLGHILKHENIFSEILCNRFEELNQIK